MRTSNAQIFSEIKHVFLWNDRTPKNKKQNFN